MHASAACCFSTSCARRGNEQKEMAGRPVATVLRFDYELLMSGRSLERPINFALTRIVPPPGVQIDPRQRPVVVVDPRAGQGPGIGGFKEQSRRFHCRFWYLASSSFFALRGLSRRRRAPRNIASIR
jgi:hypothetical protein